MMVATNSFCVRLINEMSALPRIFNGGLGKNKKAPADFSTRAFR
jgi:hypothetical protein